MVRKHALVLFYITLFFLGWFHVVDNGSVVDIVVKKSTPGIVNIGSANKYLSTGCLKIAVLGGSVSLGRGSKVNYVDLLNKHRQCNGKHSVHNYSVGGRGSSFHLSRIHKLPLANMDVIIVDTGVNDVGGIEERLTETMILSIKLRAPLATIVWCWTTLRLAPDGTLHNSQSKTQSIIEYYNVIGVSLPSFYGDNDYFKSNVLADGVHINSRGHSRLALLIVQALAGAKITTEYAPKKPLYITKADTELYLNEGNEITSFKLKDEHHSTKMAVSFKVKRAYQDVVLRDRDCVVHLLTSEFNAISVVALYSWDDVGVGNFKIFKASPHHHRSLRWYLKNDDKQNIVIDHDENFKWDHHASEFRSLLVFNGENYENGVFKLCARDIDRVEIKELQSVKIKRK